MFKPEDAKEVLDFFRWENPYDKEGDLIEEFLKKLAIEVIMVATEGDWNERGTILAFKDREGWPPIDGSKGLTLTYVKSYTYDESKLSFEVEEEK